MNYNNDHYFKKLDNVAAFYASTTTIYNPNIYRLSVRLKEKVVSSKLEEALKDTLISIPTFAVKLQRGFFWYYLEHNHDLPIISEDTHFPLRPINNINNNYFLFKVTYYEKRINVDFSHILTDGTGALYFLKTLVINYLKISHPKGISKKITTDAEKLSIHEANDDSFLKHFDAPIDKRKVVKKNDTDAFHLRNKSRKNTIDVILGSMSVTELKMLTKEKGVTITAYLIALLIYSIYHGRYKYTKSIKPITIAVPVNLRNHFPSTSMNNFFSTIIINLDVMKKDYSFDDVLEIVSSEMKRELDKDVLLNNFKNYVRLHKNIVLRFIPLFIKDLILREVNRVVSKRGATSSLSNIGVIKMPDEVSKYIDKFDMLSYIDNSTHLKLGICSFNDNLSISFSSALNDTEIVRTFFTALSSNGVNINISSSGGVK